jgi:hypothetical protein
MNKPPGVVTETTHKTFIFCLKRSWKGYHTNLYQAQFHCNHVWYERHSEWCKFLSIRVGTGDCSIVHLNTSKNGRNTGYNEISKFGPRKSKW